MAASTVKLTATMDYQDGTPFDGRLQVILSATSKTSDEIVGPKYNYFAIFSNGIAEVNAVPNALLEDGTFYTATITDATGRTVYLTNKFVIPEYDCQLHDLATIVPVTPSQQEVLELLASEVEENASRLSNAVEAVESFNSRVQALESGKAPLASPALTGTPTAPTADAGTNTAQIATTAFVQAAVAALVNSSPETLDTLKELSDALGGDSNFAATMAAQLALKVDASATVASEDIEDIFAEDLAGGIPPWEVPLFGVEPEVMVTPSSSSTEEPTEEPVEEETTEEPGE